ncbi:MAG: tRNA dihydrouridine synthase DusB [Bacillota bacterium]
MLDSPSGFFDFLLGSGFPVVSAPMASVSDKAFRLIAREHGAAATWTEMVAAPVLCHPSNHSRRLFNLEGESGVVAQLFGARPEEMAKAAMVAAAAGASAVDINMGCPVPKVVQGGAGAGLMLQPELAAAIVAAARNSVDIPVLVKLRRGWDENSIDAVVLARVVEKAGAAGVTVHGRYRSQFFSGRADWGIIFAVKQAVDIPVIGNGDVWGAEDAARMFAETGCDAVMIGRAARGNPWIFSACRSFLQTGHKLPPPAPAERVAAAVKHCELLTALQPGDVLVQVRRQADWYTRGLKGAARLREAVYRAGDIGEVISLLTEFLACC